MWRAISLVALLLQIAACAPAPDLALIERSFAGGTTGAGAVAPSGRLTTSQFGQRVREAVQNSPTLKQSKSGLEIAQANRNAAQGAFLPQVALGVNARSERAFREDGDVSPYLRVSQLVYDGGAVASDLAAARARVFESRGDQLQTAASTALAAIETYVMVLDRRELLQIAHGNVAVHEEIEQQITDRVSAGLGSNADVLTARSRAADARTRRADARTRVDRAEARFHEVFGAPPGALRPAVPAPVLDRADSQIVLNSPQVRRADAAVMAARAEWAAAQARRQPDVRLAAFADHDDFKEADFGVDLSVNYQIDSTGQRRAAIAAAQALVAQAEADREVLIREIGRELGFIRSDQEAGAERLRDARIALNANADSVAAARAQFTIGRRSLTEILDAQRDYVSAQERLILAEQSFFLTNYAALSLTGDILDLLGIVLNGWEGTQ